MRLCELRQKNVINCKDGKCIGRIGDIDFDACCGKICNIIIPGPNIICSLFGCEFEYVIPFNCIKRIGIDVIIVDIDLREFKRNCDINKTRKRI